jgi:hypothetical protein
MGSVIVSAAVEGEAAEAAVVIVGVVVLDRRASAGDDPARAAIARTRRIHRVLAVIAARLRRQQAFAVLEHAVVLPIRIRPAARDQSQRIDRFRRQEIRIRRRGRRVLRQRRWRFQRVDRLRRRRALRRRRHGCLLRTPGEHREQRDDRDQQPFRGRARSAHEASVPCRGCRRFGVECGAARIAAC